SSSDDLHRPAPPREPFADSAARDPRRLRVAVSFATPLGVPDQVDPEHRAAIEAFAAHLAELGHDVAAADPDYGLVGPALGPRGMAAVEAWLAENITVRSNLEPRTRTPPQLGPLLTGAPMWGPRAARPQV